LQQDIDSLRTRRRYPPDTRQQGQRGHKGPSQTTELFRNSHGFSWDGGRTSSGDTHGLVVTPRINRLWDPASTSADSSGWGLVRGGSQKMRRPPQGRAARDGASSFFHIPH